MIKLTKSQKGQGVVEYILVTALAALATMVVFRAFRADVSTAYKKAGQVLVNSVDDGLSDGNDGQ